VGGGLFKLAKDFADAGSEIYDLSVRTGVSAEALSEFGYAAEQSGASLNEVTAAITRMQRFTTQATGGSKTANKALAELGLTAKDLASLKPEDQFKKVASAIGAVQDPAQRTAKAMQIFGRGGMRLLPMIQDFEALTAEARAFGLVISTEDAKKADEFGDLLGLLGKTIKMTFFQAGAGAADVLKDLVQWLADGAREVRAFVQENRLWFGVAFKVAAATVALGVALVGLSVALKVAGVALGVLSSAFVVAKAVALAFWAAVTSPAVLLVAALAAAGAAFLTFTETGGKALKFLGGEFEGFKDIAVTAWGGVADAMAAGDLGLAAEIAWLGVKVAFLKGWGLIKAGWQESRDFFIDVWDQATSGWLLMFTEVWGALKVGWVSFLGFFEDAWAVVVRGLTRTWQVFAGGLEVAKAKFTPGEDSDEVKERIAAEIAAADAAAVADQDRRRQDRERRLAGIREDRDHAQKAIVAETEAEIAARRKAREAARAGDLQAEKEALAELNRLREEAARKRAEAAIPGGAWGDFLGMAGLLGGAAVGVGQAASRVEVAGTFSARAAAQMGFGSTIAEKQLKEQERANDLLEKIEEKLDPGPVD
jgi:hypothetical protein